jgi:hypothetical protein
MPQGSGVWVICLINHAQCAYLYMQLYMQICTLSMIDQANIYMGMA